MLPTELSPSLAVRLDMEVANDVQEANGRGTRATRTLAKVLGKTRQRSTVKVRGHKIYANTKQAMEIMKHHHGNPIITIFKR